MSNNNNTLDLILQEGEGQTIEFKEGVAKLDREIVAMANAMGGSVFLGINDQNRIVGISVTNRLISQIHDIARNCDPPVSIGIQKYSNVLEIIIKEGKDKPYHCQSGFYFRVGPNSQKLTRNEILNFVIGEGKIRFDEQFHPEFDFSNHFSNESFQNFVKLSKITTEFKPEDILINLKVAEQQKGKILFTNAAILFFAENPQYFFPEAFITAVRYRGPDRTSIIDRKDMHGNIITQLNDTLNFFKRHTEETFEIANQLQNKMIEEYPTVAIREALVNAVMHRDYFYDSSHIYMHIYSDRIEIENPGGLFKGLTVEELGRRSVRRNRLISELLFRMGYIEMIGSGITRMLCAMKENGNPPLEIQSTNFFHITFKKRVVNKTSLTDRQKSLLHFIYTKNNVTKDECAFFLNTSGDTALRELNILVQNSFVERKGVGKNVRYFFKNRI